jgi:hypothetical protein
MPLEQSVSRPHYALIPGLGIVCFGRKLADQFQLPFSAKPRATSTDIEVGTAF